MAPVAVAINGCGRIGACAERQRGVWVSGARLTSRAGRLALRLVFDRPEAFTLVHLNDLGAVESTTYLLKFDSVHGTWAHEASTGDDGSVVVLRSAAGREVRVPYSRAPEPAGLAAAYKAAGVQLVLECTGELCGEGHRGGGGSQGRDPAPPLRRAHLRVAGRGGGREGDAAHVQVLHSRVAVPAARLFRHGHRPRVG